MILDHLGVAVERLETSLAYYQDDLGYSWDGVILVDPLQQARVAFVRPPCGGIRFELLEPIGPDSPVTGWLKRRTRFYHVCYLVDDIPHALERFVAQGSRIVSEPKPAVAFRRVAFVFTRDRELVELAEAAPAPAVSQEAVHGRA